VIFRQQHHRRTEPRHHHFGTLEAEFFRQPDRLTATIGEEFCRIQGGSIYR
jgi:hypothetical protein